ncbi:MAG: hypothetical protein HOO91_18335 [Bacteroidales bacterium]|nr:hypothetical protein [Bacteroidales bacterium]
MKKIIPTLALLIILDISVYSQIVYSRKVETGYLKFLGTTVQVDPGPTWRGYNLDKKQNGIDLNLINGIKLKEKLFLGLGFGYLNFEGINGFSIFSDLEFLTLKTKLTPLLNLKIGYNHIWNQYENGKGSATVELGTGLAYKLKEKLNIYVQFGFLMTQQSLLMPIRIGVNF